MSSSEVLINLDRSYRSIESGDDSQIINNSSGSNNNDSIIYNDPIVSCIEVEIQIQDGSEENFEIVEADKSADILSGNSTSKSFSSVNSSLFLQTCSPKKVHYEMDENINLSNMIDLRNLFSSILESIDNVETKLNKLTKKYIMT